jgi:hypothetical protein
MPRRQATRKTNPLRRGGNAEALHRNTPEGPPQVRPMTHTGRILTAYYEHSVYYFLKTITLSNAVFLIVKIDRVSIYYLEGSDAVINHDRATV